MWLNQGVPNVNLFLKIFKDRLIACRWQEWNIHIDESERFSVYRTFCTVYDRKTYLKLDIDKYLKSATARFRLGISDIAVHHYRYKIHTEVDLMCPFCKNVKEDEFHFLLCCPVFNSLRMRYIPLKYHKYPNQFRLSLLLASSNEYLVKNLSLFLYKALQLRSVLLS